MAKGRHSEGHGIEVKLQYNHLTPVGHPRDASSDCAVADSDLKQLDSLLSITIDESLFSM